MIRQRIVNVNWNASVQLAQCSQSMAAAERSGFELDQMVVNIASSDDSLPGIEALARLARALARGNGSALGETLAAYRMLYRHALQIWAAGRR